VAEPKYSRTTEEGREESQEFELSGGGSSFFMRYSCFSHLWLLLIVKSMIKNAKSMAEGSAFAKARIPPTNGGMSSFYSSKAKGGNFHL
jgi:hypothetical protein